MEVWAEFGDITEGDITDMAKRGILVSGLRSKM